MKSEKSKSFLITIASSLFFSCGPQSVEVAEQQQSYIKAPEYSEIEQGVFLTADTSTSSVSYEGPILIWKNDINAQDVAEVLGLKDKTMELDLEYKREAFKAEYLTQKLKEEKAQVQKDIEIAKEKIAKNDLEQFYLQREQQLNDAASWLNDQNLTDVQKEKFETYCQAMIWKFASSDILKNYRFSVRPSPLSICEPYYQDAGYFTEPQCQVDPDGKSRDYFTCFWSDTGVLKTDVSYLDSSYNLLGAEDEAKLKEAIKQHAQDNKDLSTPTAILDNNLYIPFEGQEEFSFEFDVDPFLIVKDILDEHFGIPSSSDNRKILESLLADHENDVAKQDYNFNDRVVNLPFATPINSAGSFQMSPEDIALLNTLAKKTSQLFGPDLSNELKVIEAQTELIATFKTQISNIDRLLKDYKEGNTQSIGYELSEKYNKWFESRGKTASKIIEKSMVKALWAYSKINFVKKGSLLSIEFYIDDMVTPTLPLQACFDTSENIQVECGELGLVGKHEKMKVSVTDPSTGIINLEISGIEAEEVFIGPTLPTAIPFQEEDFTKDMLLNNTIKLEIMAGIYKNELPLMTGKSFIYDGNTKLYEGSVSLTKAAAIN